MKDQNQKRSINTATMIVLNLREEQKSQNNPKIKLKNLKIEKEMSVQINFSKLKLLKVQMMTNVHTTNINPEKLERMNFIVKKNLLVKILQLFKKLNKLRNVK